MVQRVVLLIFILSGGLGCSNFPRDPNETLEQVRGGTLYVGLVENRPWVIRADDEPAGVEVALVQQFADQLDAEVEWVWGGESEHMEALAHYELDLVIGGLTNTTPWASHVGLTRPYFTSKVTVGVPSSMAPIKDIEGLSVHTQRGEALAAYLEANGAVPIRVGDISDVDGAVVAPHWQLEQLGAIITDIELLTEHHVMAVPPGENGFLVQLEQSLLSRQGEIENMLRQESQR